MLKQLIKLADQLDSVGYEAGADGVDDLIKWAQVHVNRKDLEHAVQFFNDSTLNDITLGDLQLERIGLMEPEEFLPGLEKKGWLKNYLKEYWSKMLTAEYGRNFTHIVNMYNAGTMNPAIQINGMFADGMARAHFYNAIGEKMPVASYTAMVKEAILKSAQAQPQMSIAFTTAQEPITVANRWVQKRRMEQQVIKGPTKGQPTSDKVKEIVTASASPTVPEWRGLLTYTLSITKPATGLINGVIGLFIKAKLTPDQVAFLKNYISKQAEELDVTKGALKSSL